MSAVRLPLLGLALFGLVLVSSHLSAETYVSTCDEACHQRIEQRLAAARQFEDLQQHEAAAEQYAAAIAEEPLSIISQDAAVHAGHALQRAGKFTAAVPFYDTAIAIADARASEPSPTKGFWLKRNKRDAIFQRAVAWERAGDLARAATAFQQAIDSIFAELAAEPPSRDMRQDNAANLQQYALFMGRYLEARGEFDGAIRAYDHVVAIGDARADTADGENIVSIRRAKCDALLGKASACQHQGCIDEARQAISRLRSEYPASLQVAQAAVVEASLDGQNLSQAEHFLTLEQQALSVWEQALQTPLPDLLAATAEQIISTYPDTGTAIMALDKKARLLAGQQRVEEADAAFTELLDRLRPSASSSEVFLSARTRLRKLHLDAIDRDLKARNPVSNERWERFQAVCREIMSQDPRPDERALASLSLMATYGWQGRRSESAAVAEQFLAENRHPPSQAAQARFYIALADKVAGRYDAALEHLRWIKDQAGLDRNAPKEDNILPHVYYQIFSVLQRSGAPADAVSQAEQELKAYMQRRDPK